MSRSNSRFKRIVVLTGAGISAESGISTFRDKDGIWAKVDYREVATPEGFARNPQRVLDFYNMRRKASGSAEPNAGHLALAMLEAEHAARNGGYVLVVTQNVDLLHEAAGMALTFALAGLGFPPLLNLATVVAVMIAASLVIYHFVEQPARGVLLGAFRPLVDWISARAPWLGYAPRLTQPQSV